MLKKLQVALLAGLVTSSLHAMQINVTPSNAYASKQYLTNISYDLASGDADIGTGTDVHIDHLTFKGRGLMFQYFTKYFNSLNQRIADRHLSDKAPSHLVLGYAKGDSDIVPPNCDITLTKEVTNIVLDVDGCQVS